MKYNNAFILVAKCKETSTSGPANIVRGLVNNLPKHDKKIVPILMTNESSKKDFLLDVITVILRAQNSIVNVHTDGFLIPLLVYLLSLVNKRNTYYLTVHGIYKVESQECSKRGAQCYVILERFLYRYFKNLICVSEMLKIDIANIFKRTKNVFVIPNATDAFSEKSWRPDREVLELVSLGGLRKRKGIEEQLALFEYMKGKKIPFHVSLYGSEEGNLAWYEQELLKRNLVHEVSYCGLLWDKQAVYDAVSQADFQLCLSRYDTFNVAIAESLVLGCPCIVTDRCGAAYLIEDKENGLIVNLCDREKNGKIVEYICSFSSDFEKRERIWKNRYIYQDKLSWESVCFAYVHLPVNCEVKKG